MIYILAVIQMLSITLILLKEYKEKSYSTFFWAGNLLFFGLPHLISIFKGNYLYGSKSQILASVFVVLFNILYIMIRMYFIHNSRKNRSNHFNDSTEKRQYLISKLFFYLSIIVFYFYIIVHLGSIRNVTWGRMQKLSEQLGVNSIHKYSRQVYMATSGLVLASLYNKDTKGSVMLTLAILFYSTITGNRILLLPLIVSLIIYFILDKGKKITFLFLVKTILVAFSVVYLVYFLRLFRIYGGIFNTFSNYSLSELHTVNMDMILIGDGEMSLRNAFYHFIYHDNNFPNFNKGYTYIRLLLVLIPTRLIPSLKPGDFAIDMASAYKMDFTNKFSSMHPTFYGDAFANFYWYGIFIAVFWAIFITFIDKTINKSTPLMKNLLSVQVSVAFVTVARGSVYNSLFTLVSGIIIISIIKLLARFKI